MDIFLQIIYTVLVLSVLIFVHELGHFIAAKACKVRVTEFALGMGPALWKKQGKETLYALRLFPIGGYCAMTGEDEEITDDPKAMRNKPVWMRMIIVLAGSVMNMAFGLILVAIIVCFSNIPSTTVAQFDENATSVNCGLQVGDKILAVNGDRVSDYTDMATEISRCYNKDTV
ncbi:MAG: site-2 protease family protein, partial [Clostridia bacterium]|nr:site-2 protease family protein [Clostridia bacterium]